MRVSIFIPHWSNHKKYKIEDKCEIISYEVKPQ